MKQRFHELADYVQSLAGPGEVIASGFSAEDSHFIRFNHSAVRQATAVRQADWSLTLIHDGRRVDATTTLTGQGETDRAQLRELLASLRQAIIDAPKDPYLLWPETPADTERETRGALPDAEQVIDAVTAAGRGVDLVGLFAGGPIYKGFANSLGQRNWQHADNFNFEWCLYHDRDKAVKTAYAGSRWEPAALERRMAEARERVALLSRPARTLEPGRYRAYLAPAAAKEVLDMLCWGGFSLKSQRTKQSPLLRLSEGEATLDPRVSIGEDIAHGIAPGFQSDGFVRPARVGLIHEGRLANALVSPRSSREYDVPTNGANDGESPESMSLAGGDLPPPDALRALGRGLYVSNLWYLNFSDRSACRLTGMTRFATFWVENGKIQAPVNVMRFDDTVYRMLGSELESLTSEPELLLDGGSYGGRNTVSVRTPGLLLRDFTLTL